MHIGNKIMQELERQGVQVTEFAKRINKSRGYMYAIFEKADIDTALLKVIANTLSVPITFFFDEDNASVVNIGNTVNGNGNKVRQGHVNVVQESQEKEIEYLKARLKDKEDMIELLKQQLKTK